MSDRLHDTLTNLRTDVDRAALADSTAVRARGNQRTRRQAIGTSLAVVALVAGVIGISGSLTGTNKADQLPADDPTVTTTTREPSPDPTVEAMAPLDPSGLLAADELPSVPNQIFTIGETLEQATAADAEERGVLVCGGPPDGATTPNRALLRTFPSDLDAFAWQWVADYATADEADELFTDLMAACEAQGADVVTLDTAGTEPGVPGGFRASQFSADPGSEFNGEFAGVARIDNRVVVLGLRGMLREGDVEVDAFDDVFRQSVDRVANR